MSEQGSGAPQKAFEAHPDGGTTDSSFEFCRAVGSFAWSKMLDGATATKVFPAVDAVTQTGTPAAATDATTTQALVNDLRTKLLALGIVS